VTGLLRIAVTGADGFVGRGVVHSLEAAGHSVTRIVRTSRRPSDILINDIADGVPPGALRGHDAVLHLAAISQRGSQDDYFAVNRDGAALTARATAEAGVGHFVFVSSAKVLGAFSTKPFSTASQLKPSDEYSRSKAEAEVLVTEAMGGAGVSIVRPPAVYGRGTQGNIGLLLHLTKTGLPIPVPSRPNRNSLVSLDNLCRAIEVLVQHRPAHTRFTHPHDGEPLSFEGMLKALALGSGRKPRLIRMPHTVLTHTERVLRRRGSSALTPIVRDFELEPDSGLQQMGWTSVESSEKGLRRMASLT